jgi:membrane fusion protein
MSDSTSGRHAAPPFLAPTPPPWATRALASVLLLLFVVVSIAAFVVRVPEIVSASFVLAPLRAADPVRAFRSGVVTDVRASESQEVTQGQPLFAIASTTVGDRAAEWRSLESQIRAVDERLASRRERDASQRRADEDELRTTEARLESLARTIELRKQQLALARERAKRQQEGFEVGLSSWMETSRIQAEADALAVELERAVGEQVELRPALERLRHEADAHRAESREIERGLIDELDRARIRKAALDEDLVHRGNQFIVAAPCAGVVLQLTVRNPGAVVHEGEVLGNISCGGARLQAELTVPQEGAARVRPGDGVKLLYTAFPYQRYGAQAASIRWVSPSGDATGLRALADLDSSSITVNGQPRALVPGMAGRARVVVGRRTLISYVFEPIRQLRESLAR